MGGSIIAAGRSVQPKRSWEAVRGFVILKELDEKRNGWDAAVVH